MQITKSATGNVKSVLNRCVLLSWWLCLVPITASCGSVDRAEWREEVQLATGEIIVVKRTAVADKSGFPVSLRGAQREWTIALPDPRIVWKSDGSMLPIAMEIRNKNAYVAANIRSREYCKKFKDPPSSVLYFQWNGDTWLTVNKNEFPPSGRANLLMNPWGRNSWEDASGLVKTKDKQLAKPYNNGVNDPLEKTLSSHWIDACSMFKKN